jgi:hypothetical protein
MKYYGRLACHRLIVDDSYDSKNSTMISTRREKVKKLYRYIANRCHLKTELPTMIMDHDGCDGGAKSKQQTSSNPNFVASSLRNAHHIKLLTHVGIVASMIIAFHGGHERY